MFTKHIALVASLLIVLPLGGCYFSYDVRAVVIDGRLAFTTDKHWLTGEPKCVDAIEVFAYTPDRHVLWRQQAAPDVCVQDFPIFYGQPMKGARPDDPDAVAAEPLKPGVIYHVDTGTQIGGSGIDLFRLTPERRVENLEYNEVYPPEEEEE